MKLNSAAIGRRLALSRTTAMTWIRAYQRAGLVHLLPSIEKQRRPLLLVSPRFTEDAVSFCGARVLEAICETIPTCNFRYWSTGRVRMIPLIADTGAEKIGFCFSTALVPQRREWLPLLIALERRLIDRAFLLHEDIYATLGRGAALILPRSVFLREPLEWIFHRRTLKEAREALYRIHRERLVCWHPPR